MLNQHKKTKKSVSLRKIMQIRSQKGARTKSAQIFSWEIKPASQKKSHPV